MHIYRCNPFEQEMRSGYAYWWLTPIASKFHRHENRNKANEGGGGDVICAHQQTQGRSSSNTTPSQWWKNCTFKSKDEFHRNIVFTVNLTKYLQHDEQVRGFLGVDGTVNSKYHQCEVHVVVGVEYLLCYSSFDLNMQLFRRCEGLVFDELRPCVRGLAQMTSPPPHDLLCSGLCADETF